MANPGDTIALTVKEQDETPFILTGSNQDDIIIKINPIVLGLEEFTGPEGPEGPPGPIGPEGPEGEMPPLLNGGNF